VLGNEDPINVTRVPWRKSVFFLTPSKEKDALRDDVQADRVKVYDRPPGVYNRRLIAIAGVGQRH
jgi:hypothetical protein